MSAAQFRLLVEVINAHPGIMLVPVTLNTSFIDQTFFKDGPADLGKLLARESEKCLYETMRSDVSELAKRCSNLSPNQLVKLLTYTVAVRRSIDAIAKFYHCSKYYPYYVPVRLVFDKAGRANNREELVFKQIVFMWLVRMTEREPITSIKEIHTVNHPFIRLYEADAQGRKALNVGKMLRGNFAFADSKTTWQIQLADLVTAGWVCSIRDYANVQGYAEVFRLLHSSTVLSNDQPLGMIGVSRLASETTAPIELDIFRRVVSGAGKILPCGWDED